MKITRLLKLPPSIRLSLALAMLTLSVLLMSEFIGLIPDKSDNRLETRKTISESLAVQLSLLATNRDNTNIRRTLENFVSRNDNVLASSIDSDDGFLHSQYGVFSDVRHKSSTKSTESLIIVPIFRGDKRWGSVSIEYSTGASSTLGHLLEESIYAQISIIVLVCMFGYYLILRRTLKVLDPNAAVPDRVRNAFNTMAEGVIVIDKSSNILMTNDRIATLINRDQNDLIGVQINSLGLRYVDIDDREMPWDQSLRSCESLTDIHLELPIKGKGTLLLSVNCTPILEDSSAPRGALITFDDITDVHTTNIKLEKAVDKLVENQNEIKRKNKELENLANRDTLTGCYNRRAFFDRFETLLNKAREEGLKLSCIMADIDLFKSINDTFGHTVGDEMIQLFANVLQSYQRGDALVGRYGGEEFCVLLPGLSEDAAFNVAERLRTQLLECSSTSDDTRMHITASFGVSTLNSTTDSINDLINKADQALYKSKHKGRNRVSCWDSELVTSSTEHHVDDEPDNETAHTPAIREEESTYSANGISQVQYVDPVTGLCNRDLFNERLNHTIALNERMGTMTVLAILNVDMFSRINTVMGEHTGDAFLKEVGNKLKSIVRRSDTVGSMMVPDHSGPSISRLHGDEFAVVLSGMEDLDLISHTLNRIQAKLNGKIHADGKSFYLNTSIGISIFPNDGNDAHTLIDNARSAQSHAKRPHNENRIQFYSKELNQLIEHQMQMENDMITAIENREFFMVYQPKLDLATGEIMTAESLIRWNHPENGFISPAEFIPLAEKSALIVDIGNMMMIEVCLQIRRWVDMGLPDIRVSINASAKQLLDPGFLQHVKKCISDTGIMPHNLEIEITESTLIDNFDRVSNTINSLKYFGITVSLDDFGTGYSSLSYLGKLSFDCVKLDRSFLLEAMFNQRSRTLYESVVAMLKKTNHRVICEGIEDKEQLDFVTDLGCDEIQGYIISKPLDESHITRIISEGIADTQPSVINE